MKKQAPFMVIGIMMLGVVMRVPFTAVPAVLPDIAAGLGVSVSDLGVLTSIPLLMFAFCSTLAPRLAAKFGLEQLIAIVLLTMAAGSFIRIFNLPSLYLGTMLVGASIAIINVLLPSLVAVHFPHKIGLYSTLYITLMGCAATLGAMIAVPIVAASSWQFFILLLSGAVVLALAFWLPNVRNNHRFDQARGEKATGSLWKNKGALIFLLFGGLQSTIFYTEMTWLPTISQTIGLGKAEAGFLLGVFSMTSIPMSMIIPALLTRMKKEQRAWMMLGLSSLTVVGLLLMLIAPANFLLWMLIHFMLGVSTGALFPYMMLSFTLKTSNSQATAELSGMVQAGGYLIASVGPFLLGYSYPMFGSWLPLISVLLLTCVMMMWTIWMIEKEEIIH